MKVSRHDLSKLSEDEFRRRILIPLLSAIGYRDVEHYHGRNELGKDIVAWKEIEEGGRENVALVAKRGKIRASASGDVSTISVQVRQAYGSTFLDKTTAQEQPIHKVIVAASGKIGPDARKAIEAAISSSEISRHVRYWSGDDVCELLEKYMPLPLMSEQIEKVREGLKTLQSFKIEATIRDTGTVYRIEGREKGSEIAKVSFTFPDTHEGREVLERLKQFFEEGREVSVPGEFIEQFEQHEELAAVFGDGKPAMLAMGSIKGREAIPLRLIAKASGADRFVYDGIRIRLKRSGTKSAEFRTVGSREPLRLKMVFTKPSGLHISFKIDVAAQPVHRALQAVTLWKVLAEGVSLELRHGTTDEIVSPANHVEGVDPPDPELIKLLEDLKRIQDLAGEALVLPSKLPNDLFDAASNVRTAMESGMLTLPFTSFRAMVSTRQAQYILHDFSPGEPKRVALAMESASLVLCGKDIQLGRMVRIMNPIAMTEAHHALLKNSVDAGGDAHPWHFEPLPECEGVRHYFVDYLRDEALMAYDREYGDVSKTEPDWDAFKAA